MRESIPNAKRIDTAFRTLAKRFEGVQRSINASAARSMRAGEYDIVRRWMDIGKNVEDFAGRVDAFAEEWKRLVKATRIAAAGKAKPPSTIRVVPSRSKATPASRFYEPAMKAIANRGGEATSEQLLQELEKSLSTELSDADRKILSRRGIPKWQATVRSVYRDCIREGWIDNRADKVWKLTEKGRQLATGRRGAAKP